MELTGKKKKPFYKHLYIQVLIAIVIAALIGAFFPDFARNEWLQALGTGFIKLIRMIIAPLIFCAVVSGISHIHNAKKVGRVGVKAIVYFEVVSTFALLIGLIIANLLPIGRGIGAHPDASAVAGFVKQAGQMKAVDFLLNIIPNNVVGAFANGDILQVLLFAVLFGFALMVMGERGRSVRNFIDDATHALFGVIAIIVKVAPIGAFGAMAFTVGRFGLSALGDLVGLVFLFYGTAVVFVLVVLGAVARLAGFSVLKFLGYIKDELLIVFGTGASEVALPMLMEKLEKLGCSAPVVGLVVPTGYSFNLDGTNIYMTLATLFISQAMGVELSLSQQLIILVVAMLTSKGSTGVTGAGFITLAATLAIVDPQLVPGMAIVLGVDQFMSRGRGLTNFIGNGIATVVVSAWEGELDRAKLAAGLAREVDPSAIESAVTTG